MRDLAAFVAAATVEAAVFDLRPDYRALLVVADGIEPGAGADVAESLLAEAEASARRALDRTPLEQLPRIASWRDAYRSFGAKPQRTRNSVEALIRRAPEGLPRVNPLADIYNAVSVLHQIPLGGEDLNSYAGAPRLVRAVGDEPFDTVADGGPVIDHPEPGEVVWCDDAGVTCRRWNWRQGTRTRLHEGSSAALFILDALDPITDDELTATADDLIRQLGRLGRQVSVASRLIDAHGR